MRWRAAGAALSIPMLAVQLFGVTAGRVKIDSIACDWEFPQIEIVKPSVAKSFGRHQPINIVGFSNNLGKRHPVINAYENGRMPDGVGILMIPRLHRPKTHYGSGRYCMALIRKQCGAP